MTHLPLPLDKSLLDPFAREMAQTPQDANHHAEGDVFTHTMMVAEELRSLDYFKALPEKDKEMLMAAALLHDVGKIKTTKVVGSSIEAPRHAPVGAHMAREYLWKRHGLCGSLENMRLREAICLLIQYHSLPMHIIDDIDSSRKLHNVASNSNMAHEFTIRQLITLCRADVLGRMCSDADELLLRLDLCQEMADAEGCLDDPYPFASALTRYKYINGAEIWKDQLLHNDSWGEVVMMCGLPGTGKDTWISRNVPDMPVISLDEIRKREKISPAKNQGTVAAMAREEAKKYLRKKQPFVWNATNITKDMRSSLTSLFEGYGANVRIVYLETDWETLCQRNNARAEQVPQAAIERMLGKLSLPLTHEALTVEWHYV